MKIGVLVSGNLGRLVLQEIVEVFNISFILTDRNSDGILDICAKNQIPYFSGNPRNSKAIVALPNIDCDLIVSVNYLFLIEKDLIELPLKMAINFHGSLLPKYRGRTPHVWSIINNESETGITAHKIDLGCDTGEIIAQKKISISPLDTGGDILRKYNEAYPKFVKNVIHDIEHGSFTLTKQNESLATYFGKRTAEDGRIDWNWQKERIHNWIRAQARPYPGAYTFYDSDKVVIHRIRFSDFGFHYSIPNGTILLIDNDVPVVKTSNGSIELVDFETQCTLQSNKILR